MNLSKYFNVTADNGFCFTRQQGSVFAKDIAGDFNPLHDVDTKKFCVPGDLLFAIALSKLGVSHKMEFSFSGMISDGVELNYDDITLDNVTVSDSKDKAYMSIKRSGDVSHNTELATSLAQRYVEFSGHSFPHVLVPLMAQENVMINPSRPLVIYQSMSIDLLRLDFVNPTLEMLESKLEVNGKRGLATLKFCFKVGDEVVGHGEKQMVLSGLRPFDADVINGVVIDYDKRKNAYA
ncbi:MAG: DUF3581 family protein [Psychrobium sp.]|nr:DUF3581 family protein [Psychrobium sp.]